MAVELGIDVLLKDIAGCRGKRCALVTNQAAVTSQYRAGRAELLAAGVEIVRLFSPEHGMTVIGTDGLAMPDGEDELTGLPIVSLYGDRLQPRASDLADVDAVLFDLPDIGCRFYTYLWTLTHVMEACARYRRELIVLDRPNPISGALDVAEGPMLDEARCSSFIGRWALPLRHSCTLGELASYWHQTRLPELKLDVIRVRGWQRSMYVDEWRRSFVPTSPAMTSAEAALLYPGLGLLEATNLSEGRGTGMPFRVAAAPWLKAESVAAKFNEMSVPGVAARALSCTPADAKYAHQLCRAVMLHVTDRESFRPVRTGMTLIKLIHDLHPDSFRWAGYPTRVNPTGEGHLEKLLGVAGVGALFERPMPEFLRQMDELLNTAGWLNAMQPHLLY